MDSYYCCVKGCHRQNSSSKVYFFCFPRERYRQIEWLQAIGRQDLANNKDVLSKQRICSIHFDASQINHYILKSALSKTATPTLNLLGADNSLEGEPDGQHAIEVPADDYIVEEDYKHEDIKCNSCNNTIEGPRYKCLVCLDYDLCSKCEKLETHEEHCLLKIPKPMKFKKVSDLVKNWHQYLKSQNLTLNLVKIATDDSSDDDNIPIRNFKKYNGSSELSDEVKARIRDEVTRVLSLNHGKPEKKIKRLSKRSLEGYKTETRESKNVDVQPEVDIDTMARSGPEVVFADVNYHNDEPMDVKPMTLLTLEPSSEAQLHTMRLHDDLSEFMIVNP